MGPGLGGQTHRAAALAAAAMVLLGVWASPDANAAAAHTVLEGETLSGIAAANGISTESLAAYNGMATDAWVISGTTISVPAAGETATTSTSTASAGSHTVTEGETLSGIAAANGVTTESLASYNGLASDAWVITGSTLQIPAATTSTTSTTSSGQPATVPASWTTEIYSPNGTAYLASNAASNWEAMRQASLSTYGVDLYPAGSLSAYRTYDQQAYLYNLYLSGQGAPANPPGTSSHEYGTAVDVADPSMRTVVDEIGPTYGWTKVHGPDEWWHVDYVGP
jgi:LysM repeat protein